MPAQPRKAPAKKATASVRARREVRNEKNTIPPLTVTFRGEKFDIPRDRLGALFMRGQFLAEFGFDDSMFAQMFFKLLGKEDSARFLNLIREGDNPLTVANEFMGELNKAANVPN